MSGDAAPDNPDVPFEIGEQALREIFAHARNCFPNECCGWIAGTRGTALADMVRVCANAQPSAPHAEAISDRTAETAYVIAGEDLIALSKTIDSEQPAKIIYHSHPNGRAYFSATDRQVATSPWGDGPSYPVQQLVVGITADAIVEAALFGWSDQARGFVELVRLDERIRQLIL